MLECFYVLNGVGTLQVPLVLMRLVCADVGAGCARGLFVYVVALSRWTLENDFTAGLLVGFRVPCNRVLWLVGCLLETAWVPATLGCGSDGIADRLEFISGFGCWLVVHFVPDACGCGWEGGPAKALWTLYLSVGICGWLCQVIEFTSGVLVVEVVIFVVTPWVWMLQLTMLQLGFGEIIFECDLWFSAFRPEMVFTMVILLTQCDDFTGECVGANYLYVALTRVWRFGSFYRGLQHGCLVGCYFVWLGSRYETLEVSYLCYEGVGCFGCIVILWVKLASKLYCCVYSLDVVTTVCLYIEFLVVLWDYVFNCCVETAILWNC
eukprot:gene2967-1949_t